jgi:hypothetical protein
MALLASLQFRRILSSARKFGSLLPTLLVKPLSHGTGRYQQSLSSKSFKQINTFRESADISPPALQVPLLQAPLLLQPWVARLLAKLPLPLRQRLQHPLPQLKRGRRKPNWRPSSQLWESSSVCSLYGCLGDVRRGTNTPLSPKRTRLGGTHSAASAVSIRSRTIRLEGPDVAKVHGDLRFPRRFPCPKDPRRRQAVQLDHYL